MRLTMWHVQVYVHIVREFENHLCYGLSSCHVAYYKMYKSQLHKAVATGSVFNASVNC